MILLSIFLFINKEELVYKDRERWEKTGEIIWEVDTEKRLIALTFDDGPSPTFTEQILDLLAKYDARATFFVIGKQAEQYPELIKREYNEGHEIGNHTYNHYEVSKLSEYQLIKELQKAHQTILNIINEDMKLFRPTSGYYEDYIVRAAKELNYKTIIWTWGQDSRDWAMINAETISKKIIKNIRSGDIILFHDRGGDRSNTVKSLGIILPTLKEMGYKFVTVSTLLEQSNNKTTVSTNK